MSDTLRIPKPSLAQKIEGKLRFNPVLDDTIDDVDKSLWLYLGKRYPGYQWKAFLILVIWEIPWLYYFARSYSGVRNLNEYNFIFFLIFLPLLLAAYFIFWLRGKILHQFYKQFALANGFFYQQSGWLDDVKATLLEVGHNQKETDLITGIVDSRSINFLNFTYVTGSGKSQQSHQSTIFSIDYDYELPQLILLVDRQYYGGAPIPFSNKTRLKLEGDFDSYFDLYSLKEMEIEVLQVFSVEFMEKIKSEFNNFSFEFKDDKIYIFCNKFLTNKTDLLKMFNFVKYLIEELTPKLGRMKSSVAEMQSYLK